MTRTRRPGRRLPLTAAAVLLVPLSLAACSGGGDDAERFCSEAEDALAGIDASGALGDDPQAFADAIAQQREGFESIDPPAEIADDWQTFATAFAQLDDALQSVDTTDQAALDQALTEFSGSADADGLADASDRIGSYLSENCDA